MEGKYWKRHTKAIAFEYRRWRHFNRERVRTGAFVNSFREDPGQGAELMDLDGVESFGVPRGGFGFPDDLFMDISDSLDIFLDDQPLMFPNSRDLSTFSNADFVQPGLLPLQPMLEELSVDVIQAILQTPASVASTTLPSGGLPTASSQPPVWQPPQPPPAQKADHPPAGFLNSLLSQPSSKIIDLITNSAAAQVRLRPRPRLIDRIAAVDSLSAHCPLVFSLRDLTGGD